MPYMDEVVLEKRAGYFAEEHLLNAASSSFSATYKLIYRHIF